MKDHADCQAQHSAARSAWHAAVATLAYDLWLRAGRPPDQALAHWLEAERALVEPPPEGGRDEPPLPVDF